MFVREDVEQRATSKAGFSAIVARSSESLAWLAQFLDNYLLVVRELLVIQRERVRPDADLVLDGAEPFDRLV